MQRVDIRIVWNEAGTKTTAVMLGSRPMPVIGEIEATAGGRWEMSVRGQGMMPLRDNRSTTKPSARKLCEQTIRSVIRASERETA